LVYKLNLRWIKTRLDTDKTNFINDPGIRDEEKQLQEEIIVES